jgi:hypothetical protein
MCAECKAAKAENRPPRLAKMSSDERRVVMALIDADRASRDARQTPPDNQPRAPR